jgi:molecular chaperone DnaK (HSP70)
MNLSVIKTTKKGEIVTKSGSAAYIPKSIEGIKAGGIHLDRKLAELLLSNEEETFRAKVESCHRDMLEIERAKIELTDKIRSGVEINPFKRVSLEGRTFHMTKEHLTQAFESYWLHGIQQKLKVILEKTGLAAPDLVLLAGGSSRIPFIRDKIAALLRLDKETQIMIGENFEQAVGCGLAFQANDFLGADPSPEGKLALFTVDDVYLLAGGNTYTVFEKDQAVDESSGLLERTIKVPLSAPSKRFLAIYTEGTPEDRLEHVLNPIKRRFDLDTASNAVEVTVRANDKGYVEAEYRSGGQKVGENDFYIGIGQLSQWSVDVVIGMDIGTTNTSVGYFVGA